MRGVSPAQLLELWECVAHCRPHERSLQLLAAALPGHDRETLGRLDLGLRDWHLLQLRRDWFGPRIEAHGECPCCGEAIELEVDARSLQASAPDGDAPMVADGEGRRYRLPNSLDLIAVADAADLDQAAQSLFDACRLDEGKPTAAEWAQVEEKLSVLASERSIEFELLCELCGERWRSPFDPGAFFWAELDARAQALLDEVHRLAAAYGWTEQAILALGGERRSAYLERLQ